MYWNPFNKCEIRSIILACVVVTLSVCLNPLELVMYTKHVYFCNIIDVLRRSVHVGMIFPFLIYHLKVKIVISLFVFIHVCTCCIILYNEACLLWSHLIQQIMVSGRQLSVPSSSTVASTRDLYILYSVYCVVHKVCIYCT